MENILCCLHICIDYLHRQKCTEINRVGIGISLMLGYIVSARGNHHGLTLNLIYPFMCTLIFY